MIKYIGSKLSLKVICSLIIILFAATSIIRLFGLLLFDERLFGTDRIVLDPNSFYFILAMIGLIIIIIFSITINKIVVSRVRRLNIAIDDVVNGNLDINVDTIGNDELSLLTSSFNKMTNELRANEYLSKEFVRNVSHEFKTPLSAIRGYAELIESETDLQVIKDYANIITSESDRLSSMSASIIQLSLLDSTVLIKKEDTFSPSEQIRNTLRLMHTNIEDKFLEFDLHLEEFTITNNEHLLNQVWLNLISNAIKFSSNNGKIVIEVKLVDKRLYVEIKDNGIGISDEDKNKIFTQFYMCDKSRNNNGSGLGLPITKKIIDKLGGTIFFDSKLGEGTKFIVLI